MIFIFLFLITGCTSEKINKEKDIYDNMIDDLKEQSIFDNDLPFNIDIVFEKDISSELTYTVVIDSPKEEIKNISAIAIHDCETEDIYPTIGIFDDKLSLISNVIDVDNNIVEGIILVGYIKYNGSINDFDGIIKVLIEYENKNGNNKKVYYQYQNKTK